MATIKGVWKLNQDLTDTTNYGPYYTTWWYAIPVNGTIGGRPFTALRSSKYGSAMNELVEQLEFVSKSPILINLPACEYAGKVRYGEVSQLFKSYLIEYGTVADGGINEKYRYIDFGTEEQDIPDDVYRWFEDNATQWFDEISTIETPTVKGIWVLNEKPVRPDENLIQNVNFSSGYLQYESITVGELIIIYGDADEWDSYPVYDYVNWMQSGARIIYFGTEEQEVFHEFYDWLTANATKQALVPGNHLEFSSPSRFTLATYNAAKNWDGVLEYSTDATSWSVWDGTTTLSADSGKLYLRGTGNTIMTSPYYLDHRWVLSGTDISCNGNIENLLDCATVAKGGHPEMAEGCFNYLFYGCKSLISAPALPATVLSNRCYFNLFFRTGLKVAPELPATSLSFQCYFGMFESCENLIVPPALPATNLAAECYKHMFQYCTSLTKIPKLPATTLEQDCYAYMFRGCTSMKLSTTQTAEYKTAFRVPTSGTATSATNALLSMFDNTGGTFSGTPSINTTYYLYEEYECTLITYDGVTVEMDGDLPATLECEGKKARTDIVIIPAFPIKIAYGGIVHTADEGTPATLVCSGKKMRADVVITAEITTNFFLADGSMLITSDGQIFETQ